MRQLGQFLFQSVGVGGIQGRVEEDAGEDGTHREGPGVQVRWRRVVRSVKGASVQRGV